MTDARSLPRPLMFGRLAEPRVQRLGIAVFAALCYVPLLLTDPGKVHADTKSYLYLDPSRLLAGARSMWDPEIGLGTTSHQTIGYLFPLGPYYWFTIDVLGMPAWIAQRLALGTMLFAAGMGVRYLLRVVGIGGAGVAVGMMAYTFTPYVLQYSARLSVLLGPWSALPWLTAFTMLALRHGGWRYPALIALTIQLVGSINLTAIVLVVIGPVLWAPYAVMALRECDWRRVGGLAVRVASLSVFASLWWMSGLWVEGGYGLSILRFTESIQTVAATSYPYELLRGLGYWFFYGRDRIGHWNDAFLVYSLNASVVFASLAIPALAFAAAAVTRWRLKGYFALLVLIGVAIAVGSAPYDDPSPLGSVYKSFATTSTVGFALRSTARAAPLMVLGLSVLLAAGVTAFTRELRALGRTRSATLIPIVIVGLVLLNAPGVWKGSYYSDYLARDEAIPQYWTDALADLDAASHDTRVLALPGADFAAYRWGDTVDPIEPGLIDRPYIARELVPWGSEATTNLLVALDRRLQEGTLDPDAVAPIARLMGVGDIVLRFDLETDRFTLIPAGPLWQTFTDANADTGLPDGLREPVGYGDEIPGSLRFPELGDLARPPSEDPDPPPVAVVGVDNPVPVVRSKSAVPIVVSGDGDGLVDLAAAGVIDGHSPIVYSGSNADDPRVLRDLPDGAVLVVTDSNRRRGMRWAGLYTNYGYTEVAGEEPLLDDLLDQRLVVFPDAGDDAATVTELRGIADLRASRYGTASFGYSPGERPAMMFDGNRETSWVVDGGSELTNQWVTMAFDAPITTDRIEIVQPRTQRTRRFLSRISVRFDGGPREFFDLGAASRRIGGQALTFETRTFERLEIRMEATSGGGGIYLGNLNPIGIAELRIRDTDRGRRIRVEEVARVPVDLLDALGADSDGHPLAFAFARDLTMDGTNLWRRFEVPSTRSFGLSGTLQLSSFADDAIIDELLGIPAARDGGVTATSSGRLGDPATRGSAALDGDLSTAWMTPIAFVKEAAIRVDLPAPRVIDHLDLAFTADGRHSMPTQLTISTATGDERVVDLPVLDPAPTPTGYVTARVDFEPIETDDLEVEISDFQPVERSETVMPAGIVELGIEGVQRGAPQAGLALECRDDLLEIDGTPIGIRARATTVDLLDQRRVEFTACEPVELAGGAHELRSRMNPDSRTALDLTRVLLVSDSRGEAGSIDDVRPVAQATAPVIIENGRSRVSAQIAPDGGKQWLILGQSINRGWVATLDGEDLGAPALIDGYANGWLVDTASWDGPRRVVFEWRPQRIVSLATWISGLAAVGCLALVWRTRRRRGSAPAPLWPDETPSFVGGPRFARPAGESNVDFAVPGLLSTVVLGCAAALLVGPMAGVAVVVVLTLARVDGWIGRGIRWLPTAVLGFVACFMAGSQLLRDLPPRFDWPSQFESLRVPTWIALFAFVGLAIAGSRASARITTAANATAAIQAAIHADGEP